MASVRTYGNLALSANPAPQRQRPFAPSPQERKRLEQARRREQLRRLEIEKKREAQRRAKARRDAMKRIGLLVYVCTLFAVLSLVIVGYAGIATLKMENNALSKQISGYNKQIATLQMELTQKTDLQHIREQAQSRLNMGYPKEYQVLLIELAGQTATTGTGSSSQSGQTATTKTD
jgi:cell division protein FtsL